MSSIDLLCRHIWVLRAAAAVEMITGIVLIIYPQWLIKMLFATDGLGAGVAAGRIAGIALLALGVGCWRAVQKAGDLSSAMLALLIYNLLVMLYFIYLGIAAQLVGILLWPAAILHAALTGGLAYLWAKTRSA